MAVRPDDHDRCLDKTGQHRRRGGTGDPKCRRAEFTVDQNIVPDQIDKDCCDTGLHRHDRLAAFTQRAGIDLRHSKRKEPRVHHQKILPGSRHRRARIHAPAVAGEPEPHQILPLQRKQHRTRHGQDQRQHKLEPHRVPHTLLIPFSGELRGKNTDPGKAAEDHQIIYK